MRFYSIRLFKKMINYLITALYEIKSYCLRRITQSIIYFKSNFIFSQRSITLIKLILLLCFCIFSGIITPTALCETVAELSDNTSKDEESSKEEEQPSKWKKYHLIGTLITMGLLISWLIYKLWKTGDNPYVSDSASTSSDSDSTSSSSESESSNSGSPSAKDNTVENQNIKKEPINTPKKEEQPRSSPPREEFSEEELLLVAKLDRYGEAIVDNFHNPLTSDDLVRLYNLGRRMGVTFDVNSCSYLSLGFLTLSDTEGTYNESVVRALGSILYCIDNKMSLQSIHVDSDYIFNVQGSHFLQIMRNLSSTL